MTKIKSENEVQLKKGINDAVIQIEDVISDITKGREWGELDFDELIQRLIEIKFELKNYDQTTI
jgi:hypothetical protein